MKRRLIMGNSNNTKSKKEVVKNTQLIKGMERSVAKRYEEMRYKVDNKLCQIMGLSNVIAVLDDGDEGRVEMIDIANTAGVINEIAENIYGMLDEFIGVCGVTLDLKENANVNIEPLALET
jgi:hypothetical protein